MANKTLQEPAGVRYWGGAQAQGEGVGGEVKTTLATRAVAHSHPPTQHISLGRWENSRKPI